VLWDVPARPSPHAAAADGGAVIWAEAGELCQDTAELTKLTRVRPGLLAAYCHPEATAEDVTLVAKWLAWLFLLDDRIDEGDLGRDADLLGDHLHGLQGVALGVRAAADPMGRALAEIIAQASDGMGDIWRLRFRRAVSDYLLACVWQAAHRQAAHHPDPGVFPHWRRTFGAILPSFDLVERTEGGALPPSVHYSRPYQGLLLAAADLVCWTNDLMTVEKEAAHGDPHNLVLVTEHDRRQDRRTASAAVSAHCERRIRAYASARDDLPRLTAALGLPEPVRARADACAASLLVWTRGHLEWGLITPRYRAGAAGTGAE
jgi:hypothetical protein